MHASPMTESRTTRRPAAPARLAAGVTLQPGEEAVCTECFLPGTAANPLRRDVYSLMHGGCGC